MPARLTFEASQTTANATANLAAWHAEKEASRFVVSPDTILAADAEVCVTVAETITDDMTRKELCKRADDGGRKLILELLARRDAHALRDVGSYGQSIQKKIQLHEATGMAEASIEAFNMYKSELTRLIDILPPLEKAAYPDAIVAGKLASNRKKVRHTRKE